MTAVVEHINIVDPYIHEPKGVATATSGDVYKADGVGSGVWGTLALGEIDYTPTTVTEVTVSLTGTTDGILDDLTTVTSITGSLTQAPDGTLNPIPYSPTWNATQSNTIEKNFAELQVFYNEQKAINEELRKDLKELGEKTNEIITALNTLGLNS